MLQREACLEGDLETQGTWEGGPGDTQLGDRVPAFQLGTNSPRLCSKLDVVMTQMSISACGLAGAHTVLSVCPS